MSTFNILNKIRISNASADLDVRYGPWNSVAEARANVTLPVRERGLTVGVIEGGKVQEYWWKSGTTDGDLIYKVAEFATTGVVSASGPFIIGTNVSPVTGNLLHIKGGHVRIEGIDLSNVPGITAFDTDGQSLFDLRSASPESNYNLSIASSGVGHFIKFFGGREGDPNPFIVVKAGEPLRFASFDDYFNKNFNFKEYARVDTKTGNFAVGTETPLSGALVHIESPSAPNPPKGFLPPRLTTARRDQIFQPPAGLMIYNTTTNLINFYNGTTWVALATAAA